MRPSLPLVLLAACSGEPSTREEPEICGDGVDNNANGLVDCDEPTYCGGVACNHQSTDDTDSTEPLPIAEVVYDPSDCCSFTIEPGNCPFLMGTILVVNRSTEDMGNLDANCDLIGGSDSAIEWQVLGSADSPTPFMVDAEVPAGSQATLQAYYNCQVAHQFKDTCRVKLEVGLYTDNAEFAVTASVSTPP